MCGIVGLLIKDAPLRNRLGALMVPMLTGMTERGPDSAGLAVYTAPVAEDRRKLSPYIGEGTPWTGRNCSASSAGQEFGPAQEIATQGNHAVLTSGSDPDTLTTWLARSAPEVAVLSVGQSIDLYSTGAPPTSSGAIDSTS